MRPPQRSLFLRFFLASAATLFIVWVAVLLWEVRVIQARFETVQVAETKGWTRQLLASLGNGRRATGEMRDTLVRIEAVRDAMYVENGFAKPLWRLQAWQGGALIYASPGAATAVPQDRRWIVWAETDPVSGVTIRLAQELVIAWTFGFADTSHQFAPLLYCFPFLLMTAWFSIRYGLRPLNAVVAQIERRSAANLSPLRAPAHRELAPLVDSTNRLMDDLSGRLKREQEFLVDAAHQLKTPLAVVRLNAELIADANDPATAAVALAGLREGVNDAAHVVHQLLALARSGAHALNEPLAQLDLAELVRGRLALAAPLALMRNIEIEFEGPERCQLALRRNSVAALIDNLAGNAVKYSPDGGRVQIRLAQGALATQLSIADQGPGIPSPMRRQVFERFFRMPDQDQPGSGLGLAIVERAAAHNHASVSLHDAIGGRGLLAVVEFPPHQDPDNQGPTKTHRT